MVKRKSEQLVLFMALAVLLVVSACSASGTGARGSQKIKVVAAENFYGNIVAQIGGGNVEVTNILSDPQVDPHEYESSVANAKAVTVAQLVVKNGGGYDGWMDKLLEASPNDERLLITAYDVAATRLEDNEHVWYSLDNMQVIARAVTDALKKLDGAHATEYENNKKKFDQSLATVQAKLETIKTRYANTPVGLTETIFLYQTGPMNLNVLTPFDFQKAVAESEDPPASAVATANNQVKKKEIKVLIYNEQTSNSLTTNLLNEARAQHISIVSITETMPTTKTYQQWMLDQLTALESALKGQA